MRLSCDVARPVGCGHGKRPRPERRGIELGAAGRVSLAAVEAGAVEAVVARERRPDLLSEHVRRVVGG